MIDLWNRLRRFNATVDELTTRMFAYVPDQMSYSGIHPGDTARFGVVLGAGSPREHG